MTTSSALYPRLKKSYKNAYPFKLATTSFIYPEQYVPNVDLLGPFLDEIEILFFESPGNFDLSLKAEIKELKNLAEHHGITYNVHLPLDVSISATETVSRQKAVDEIQKVIKLTTELLPSTYTLHLPCPRSLTTAQAIKDWQLCASKGLEMLLATGFDSQKLSIETLEYPFEWAAPLIEDFDLSVCIDLGHLIVNGFDVASTINRYASKATIIHLHGASGGKDHLPLNALSQRNWEIIGSFILWFKGVVSLEVFSFEYLEQSLTFLDAYWKHKRA